MGTHGYAAPEYLMTGHLTAASDVYSFGVVLLELLTGRKSMDKSRPNREQNLAEWARPQLKYPHKLNRIMDPRLEGLYSGVGAEKAAELAYKCLSHRPKARPNMSTIVKSLEPLQDFNDIHVGPFVYTAPKQQLKETKKDYSNGSHGQGHRTKSPALSPHVSHLDPNVHRTLSSGPNSPMQPRFKRG